MQTTATDREAPPRLVAQIPKALMTIIFAQGLAERVPQSSLLATCSTTGPPAAISSLATYSSVDAFHRSAPNHWPHTTRLFISQSFSGVKCVPAVCPPGEGGAKRRVREIRPKRCAVLSLIRRFAATSPVGEGPPQIAPPILRTALCPGTCTRFRALRIQLEASAGMLVFASGMDWNVIFRFTSRWDGKW